MKIGRNEPCPCGSDARAQTDPEEDAEEGFWSALDAADDARKVEMVRERIAQLSPDELDGEEAFELINAAHGALDRLGRYAETEGLLDALRARHPEAYDEELGWFEVIRVELMVMQGRDPMDAFLGLCARANQAVDLFFGTLNMMAYHGHLEPLIQGLPIAFGVIDEDPEIFASASEELMGSWTDLILGVHLERDPALRADDPALLEALALIPEPDRDDFASIMASALDDRRGGVAEPSWSLERFDRSFEDAADDLTRLLWSFDAALAGEGWSAPRREMAGDVVFEMVAQLSRDLHKQRTAPGRSRGKKGKRGVGGAPGRPPSLGPRGLMMSAGALDRFIAQSLSGPFFGRSYVAEVLALASPWWCAFLIHHGLGDAARLEETWSEVRARVIAPLHARSLEKNDPVLTRDLEALGAIERLPRLGA